MFETLLIKLVFERGWVCVLGGSVLWVLGGAVEWVIMVGDKLDWVSFRTWVRSDEEEETCFDLPVGHVFGGQKAIPA